MRVKRAAVEKCILDYFAVAELKSSKGKRSSGIYANKRAREVVLELIHLSKERNVLIFKHHQILAEAPKRYICVPKRNVL